MNLYADGRVIWLYTTYSVCLGGEGGQEPLPLADPSSVVASLPAPAPELLGGARRLDSHDPGFGDWRNPCLFAVTTEAARTLADTFDAAGWRNTTFPDLLSFRLPAPQPDLASGPIVALRIEPQLPHGVPTPAFA